MGSGTISFEIDAPFSEFLSVALDDRELVRGVDYLVTEGSTIISLQQAFLGTLANGDYILTASFQGGTAQLPFGVQVSTATTPPPATTTPVTSLPATGDDAPTALMLATLLSALGVVLLLSLRKKAADSSGPQ